MKPPLSSELIATLGLSACPWQRHTSELPPLLNVLLHALTPVMGLVRIVWMPRSLLAYV